ncbi:MAG: hypothetical protein RRY16_01905 [Bacilli bacterium]
MKDNNLKELLKDSKTKSIILLCLYLFMMSILIIIVRLNPKKVVEPSIPVDSIKAIEKLKIFTNYQYEYLINYNEKNSTFIGTRYNEEEIFMYDNKNYYLKGLLLYEINNNKISPTTQEFDIRNFRTENIYLLINNIKPTLELEIEGVKSKEYYIHKNNLKITTYEKDNIINKIVLFYIDNNVNCTIHLTNVGKITSLNTNFELEE